LEICVSNRFVSLKKTIWFDSGESENVWGVKFDLGYSIILPPNLRVVAPEQIWSSRAQAMPCPMGFGMGSWGIVFVVEVGARACDWQRLGLVWSGPGTSSRDAVGLG
jgi:hypothetical protein